MSALSKVTFDFFCFICLTIAQWGVKTKMRQKLAYIEQISANFCLYTPLCDSYANETKKSKVTFDKTLMVPILW